MIITIEKIWDRFHNKFKAVNAAALEARHMKEEQTKGLIEKAIDPILEVIKKLNAGRIEPLE